MAVVVALAAAAVFGIIRMFRIWMDASDLMRAGHLSDPQPVLHLLGPVSEWPWGQKPGPWMIDPTGHLAGPLAYPEGWIAAHRSNIDAGLTLTLRRADDGGRS
jgi:hypothetical protein